MYVVLVRLDVKPEQTAAFLSALIEVTHNTNQNEPGASVRFDVIRDSSNPNRLFVYEAWRDSAAFEAHVQTPYYKQFGIMTKDWLAAPPAVLCLGTNLFPPDDDESWR